MRNQNLRVVKLLMVGVRFGRVSIAPAILISRRIGADGLQAVLQTSSKLRGIEEGEASMDNLKENLDQVKCKAGKRSALGLNCTFCDVT